MSDRCSEVENKINHFVEEVYAKNNKEFLQLSFIVGELRDVLKEHIHNNEEYKKAREAREAPMLEWFEGMTFLKRFILGFAVFGTTILALYFAVKKLLE